MKLQGQVALVTGGGRGLGRATALALAREGANVVVADILEDGSAQTERDLNALGVESMGIVCDVSSEANVESLVERTLGKFGQIDIVVNTVAWIDPPGLLVDMPLEVWEKTLLYDLTTHFLVCKHALKQSMIPRNYGRIVNIVLGVTPAEGWSAVLANVAEPGAGRRVRSEPLRCWAWVEHQDATLSMEGLVRDQEWLDEPGGAEFPEAMRGPHRLIGYASATSRSGPPEFLAA